MNWLLVTAVIAIMPFLPSRADAATLFNNLGAGDLPLGGGVSIQWEQSLGAKGDPRFSGQAIAMSFSVSGGDFLLDSITVGMWQVRGVSNLRISITTDMGGEPSHSLLEVLAFNPSSFPSAPEALTFASSAHPLLSSGSDYWVLVEPSDPNASDDSSNATYGWSNNPVGATSSHLHRSPTALGAWGSWIAGSSGALEPSLRVDASAVPEPSVIWILAGLASALSLSRRRHHHPRDRRPPPLVALDG